MKKTLLLLMAVSVLPLLVFSCNRPTQQAAVGQQRCAEQKAIDERTAALEKSIEKIMQTLSGQAKATDAPNSESLKLKQPSFQSETEATAQLPSERLDAAAKSLNNIASFMDDKDQKPGSNCRWVRECVYITCCQWGAPPSDPGTVKCLQQCCGAWENRLVCD